MRDILQYIMEADKTDPFVGPDPDVVAARKEREAELEKQRAARQRASREERERQWEEENDRKIDTCPHCGADLRDSDVGVYVDEVSYGQYSMYFDDGPYGGYWEYGDSDYGESESGDSHCGKCNRVIDRGVDYDVLPR